MQDLTGQQKDPIAIDEFPELYAGLTVRNVRKIRQAYKKKDKSILAEEPVRQDVASLAIEEGRHRYSINSDGVTFEALFIDNPASDMLYVSLSSAAHASYPMFRRWSYYKMLNAKILCIDDPSYVNFERKYTRWYYGTREKSYLCALIPVIEKFIEKLNISRQHVIILGSSAGGYAALYLANALDGTNAFALGPQVMPALWREGHYVQLYKENGIDLLENDIFHRNNLVLTARQSKFFISFNMVSRNDAAQFKQFCKNQQIEASLFEYGMRQHQNYVLWLHASSGARPHSCYPERFEIKLMEFLLLQMQKGRCINNFTKLSKLISEYMNIKYFLLKTNEQNLMKSEAQCAGRSKAFEDAVQKQEKLLRDKERKLAKCRKRLAKLKKTAENNSARLQKIKSSLSYRIGRLITCPFRLFMKACKK